VTLDIIGAGFGRTGTNSMRLALEQLGFGPCHHMYEVMTKPRLVPFWEAAVTDGSANWEELFQGYRSTVDWPACDFWAPLSETFPDARVLLTTRSAESWWKSVSKTIFTSLQDDSVHPDPHRQRVGAMVRKLASRTFGDRLNDRAHCMAVFEAHNAAVEAAIPEGRRLTYHVGDGWEPLCAWLGAPVPDTPFPKTNSREEFFENLQDPDGSKSQHA